LFRIVYREHRQGLSSELLESLFCGLPDVGRRMSVFVAAADESDGPVQTGPFVYGGFVAPTRDWIDCFAPAWQERVLNGTPTLPYFHMTEVRNPRWQRKNGIPYWEAERRIEEAVRVVSSMGSLQIVRTSLDGGHFRQVFRSTRVVRTGPQPGTYQFEPDYIGFIGFARGALQYVFEHYPDAEKVDLVVERKQKISHHLSHWYDSLVLWLKETDQPRLLGLLGELIPGDKTRVPLQAADLAMWHIRRNEAKECEAKDVRRLRQMFEGRPMVLSGLTNDEISWIAARNAARGMEEQLRLERGDAS
jgi:hypothetical protein